MTNLTRRDFLGKSILTGAALAAAPSLLSLEASSSGKPKKLPLGFQVWTIKDKLIADFPGTLKMMAGLGYQSVEMCSPPGYESSGFGPLMKLKPKEMLQIVNDSGLILESTHYGMGEFRSNLDERINFAAETGQKQMVLSSFWLPKGATMSDWLKAADELNEMGVKTKKAGIQMAFHNHHMEFEKIDEALIYDELLKRFDPEYVKMQFQVAVVNIGYKAADYFNNYPDRFISAHLADWSILDQKSVPIGKGIVDWVEFFQAVKKGGVKNIFVEMDPGTFAESATFYQNM
jgi:sugar phosphate isomerase/epimerase